jgi:hypothetical protein
MLFIAMAAPALCQTPAFKGVPPQSSKDEVVSPQVEEIPDKPLKFTAVESDPTVVLSPVTLLPQCGSEMSLYLDMLDPKDLRHHSVVSLHGGKSHTFLPSSISDVHDIDVFGFSSSDSTVGFLVRGTKAMPGSADESKSPAGFAWKGYHNYISRFGLDGGYEGSIEVPVSYQLSHLAILPSGEFLVSGYDSVNSVATLLFVSQSGQILRSLDLPATRAGQNIDNPVGSVAAARAARSLMGSIVFTSFGQDVLVWRRNSGDPILDVGPGGAVREVPLKLPTAFLLVDMVPANDRWVVHLRRQEATENHAFDSKSYAYFELRPEDASVSSRLLIPDGVPQFLACENDGHCLTYRASSDNKIVLFESD